MRNGFVRPLRHRHMAPLTAAVTEGPAFGRLDRRTGKAALRVPLEGDLLAAVSRIWTRAIYRGDRRCSEN